MTSCVSHTRTQHTHTHTHTHMHRIIIIIQLNVLKLGPNVGGPIGQPKALELVRVDPNSQPSSTPGVGGPPPMGNRSGGLPQQGGYGGGGGGGYGGGRGGGGGMGWQNPAQNGYKPGRFVCTEGVVLVNSNE